MTMLAGEVLMVSGKVGVFQGQGSQDHKAVLKQWWLGEGSRVPRLYQGLRPWFQLLQVLPSLEFFFFF